MAIPNISLASSGEEQNFDQGIAIKQAVAQVDQMVLLPSATIRALQNDIAELRKKFGLFKEDTRRKLDSFDNALSS